MWSQGLVSPDWTALITPLPRSRVLEHLKYSLSAQDDSDWLSIVHRSAWIITIQLEGDWMNPCISTHHWSIVISYGHVTIILVVSLSGGNMMNHEESNESRDESRESTPAAPGLRLGFASKTSRIREVSSKPSTPVAQKRQVVMAACKVSLSWPSSISARSTQGHLVNLGLLCRIGSSFSTSPKRTCLFPASLRLMASRMFRRIGVNRIFRSSNRNLSVTFRKPPFCTTSGMADTNLVPRFSLWAHSVSSSTLYSCSSGTGQRDVNLACVAHGAFTFYNVLSISLGLRIVVDVFCIVISCNFNVLYSTIHMCVCICIKLFAMHIICIYIYMHYIYVYFNSYLTYYIIYISYIYCIFDSLYSTLCIEYSIIYMLQSYRIYCILYTVYCILYIVYCFSLRIIYYTIYIVHPTL